MYCSYQFPDEATFLHFLGFHRTTEEALTKWRGRPAPKISTMIAEWRSHVGH